MKSKETIKKIIICLKGNLKSIQEVPYRDETIRDLKNDIDNLENILKDLEVLEQIRNTLKVESEETINPNLYWLYIEERPILITRKIYDLLKDELEEDGNNEKL